MAAIPENLLPLPSKTDLREAFVGRSLQDVPTPAAIVDIAVVKRNCNQMLKACEALQLDFRPHVKTHKTAEVARLQLGGGVNDARVVVSTVAEAEYLTDYLIKAKNDGTGINVLYGIPLPPAQIYRLARLARRLGPRNVSVLVDDPSQLSAANTFREITAYPLQMFIKVDTGYHRAGVPANTAAFRHLVEAVFDIESHGVGVLVGFYSHAGHSYGGNSAISAIETLIEELEGLEKAVEVANSLRPSTSSISHYVLSVGASPTATSIENLQADEHKPIYETLKGVIQRVKSSCSIELHAGVYPSLDMQQLATHASRSAAADARGMQAPRSLADVALSILVEVASIYTDRQRPEVLIAAGTLALGREPCKSYEGWGIVSGWGCQRATPERSGWMVGRISQEHSLLTEDVDRDEQEPAALQVGQKVRIYPNHACIASAGFPWYLVVDSSLPKERHDEIVDVWVRCRGW